MKEHLFTSEVLKSIEKPAQYLGGEKNSVVKDPKNVKLNFCLAFPDTYEVGMSHVGIQILYHALNENPNYWVQRAFVPQRDMEDLLRAKGQILCSLEENRALKDFDVVGFSLQYELCATGILAILDLADIPFHSRDRGPEFPLIIGGGPVTYHPEPFSDFFDAFLVGDGEELVPEFLEKYLECKELGLAKSETLEKLSTIDGVYIPAFFESTYDENNNFKGMRPLKAEKTSIRRRIIPSLEDSPFPTKPIIPNIKAVHDRLSVEVMRGCVRGCRFCQAGYLYRPQRERSPEQVLKIVEDSLENTGFEELSLLSLSTADYCSILPLLSSLKERFATNDTLAISFPSTRVDALKPELLQEVQPVRRSGFTIAPEAGTQRLRDVINKGVTDEEIIETCTNVFRLGWNSVKMYFMIGLPTETDEDIHGIIDIAKRVKAIAGNKNEVTVSVSTLVPKPHTPFQWSEQISISETLRRQEILAKALRSHRITFRYHEAFSSFLEGIFARGDRKLSALIVKAYELGSRLDAWMDKASREIWEQAFSELNIDPWHYLHARNEDAELPWDHIDCDISKAYFLKEWQRATKARTTPDCLTKSCSVCGACDYDATRNVLFDRSRSEARLNIVNPPWNAIIEARENQKTYSFDQSSEELDQEVPIGEDTGSYSLKDYLQTEKNTRQHRSERINAPVAQRLRLEYSKQGTARFIGHLELSSVFFRACRRANVPLAFSKGFHPKPKLLFGPPLQLGLESLSEFVDFLLTETRKADDVVEQLNEELPHGFRILRAWELDLKAAPPQNIIKEQTYRIAAQKGSIPDEWKSIEVARKRKGKTKRVSLGAVVSKMTLSEEGLDVTLPFDPNQASLKPYEIVEALGFNGETEVIKIESLIGS